MAENFFSNPNPAPQSTGFMTPAAPAQVAPTGNPFVNQGAPVNGYGANPQMGAATAAMIYQRMGYWDGNPTEIDIFSDIMTAHLESVDETLHCSTLRCLESAILLLF